MANPIRIGNVPLEWFQIKSGQVIPFTQFGEKLTVRDVIPPKVKLRKKKIHKRKVDIVKEAKRNGQTTTIVSKFGEQLTLVGLFYPSTLKKRGYTLIKYE